MSAQRRQHELGLLAASGADPPHLRRSVLATAAVLGAAGGLFGLALGIAAAAATLPWLEEWSNRAVDGLTLSSLVLTAIPATGVFTAIAASWLSARSAARTPVAAALTGRRPPRTSSRRLLVTGVIGTALGLALTILTTISAAATSEFVTAAGLLTGTAATMIGLGSTSPWLVEQLTARIGRLVPLGVGLALRDIARFRSRTAPIVVAIVAGLGLSVTVGTALDSIKTGLTRSTDRSSHEISSSSTVPHRSHWSTNSARRCPCVPLLA